MKENKSPAFQFYARDFLSCSSVAMMSNEAVGCYIKLLCHCWLEGGIPSDSKRIGLLCGLDGKRILKIWPQISDRFVESINRRGFLINERIEKERQNQIDNREKRSISGKKGAEARWQTHSNAIDLPMAKNGSASASASSTTSSDKKESKNHKKCRATIEEVIEFIRSLGLPDTDAHATFYKWEGNGWTNGGKPIKDWKATIRSWHAGGYLPSQKNGTTLKQVMLPSGKVFTPLFPGHRPDK